MLNDRQIDRSIVDRETDQLIDGSIDRQTDGFIGRWINHSIDGQTNQWVDQYMARLINA